MKFVLIPLLTKRKIFKIKNSKVFLIKTKQEKKNPCKQIKIKMQSIIKDFLEKVTVTPPPTFWKYQGDISSTNGGAEALTAELEVARLGLGGNTNNNNNTTTATPKNLHQYIPLATTTLTKCTGHTVFSQIQGALRHGGRPSLSAFQNLNGAEHCMNISSPTTTTSSKLHEEKKKQDTKTNPEAFDRAENLSSVQ